METSPNDHYGSGVDLWKLIQITATETNKPLHTSQQNILAKVLAKKFHWINMFKTGQDLDQENI